MLCEDDQSKYGTEIPKVLVEMDSSSVLNIKNSIAERYVDREEDIEGVKLYVHIELYFNKVMM